MNISTLVRTAALFTLFATAMPPSMACGPPDLKTHVGKVLSVDKSAGTFTLIDAESMSPVTFSADAKLLEQLSRASGNVAVKYETIGETLRALELK